jgi:hypothetical protein
MSAAQRNVVLDRLTGLRGAGFAFRDFTRRLDGEAVRF